MNTLSAELVDVARRTRTLLLDFDGPMCSIFAGFPAPLVAGELRQLVIRRCGHLLPGMANEDDPLQILRLTNHAADEALTTEVAAALRDAELEATKTAEPTPFVLDVVQAALETGRRLVVVSNNSREAVCAYLDRHGLRSSFVKVVGRYDGLDPDLMKPNRHLVMLALIGADAAPWSSTLVGDSVTDVEAARAVPMDSIGYANKPRKAESLANSGATAVIGSMAELASALRYGNDALSDG